MTKYSTMRISEVMRNLEWYKENYGDLPVAIASDEDWNSFGTAGCFDNENGILIISPFKDSVELDEIKKE